MFKLLQQGQLGRRRVGGAAGSGSGTTWNPSEKSAGFTLSGGNLIATKGGATDQCRATAGALGSKRYCEINIGATGVSGSNDNYIGVSRDDGAYTSSAFSLLMRGNNSQFTGGSSGGTFISGTAGFVATDIMMVAVDTTSGTSGNRKCWIGKNGSWLNGDPAAGTGGTWSGLSNSVTWKPYLFGASGSSAIFTLNCGATAFTYTPPSGFSAF
jgi:hypothetical protein